MSIACPAEARYITLATYRRDGREVATPVWVAAAEGRFYIFSAGNAGKVKRIRANPRARIAPCDVRGKVAGPWSEVTARVVADAGTVARAYAALRAKYGWQMRWLDFLSGLAGRKQRRAIIELELLSSREDGK